MTTQSPDPFDSLLSLEEQYHAEGRTAGLAEGAASGRIEGRVFGLEKSFEKFIELGHLSGRSAVWNARLPDSSSGLEVGKEEDARLAPLKGASERLTRHVGRLVELTDQDDVSRENSEEGVQDFDDRLREAKAKAVLVERLVGEGKEGGGASGAAGVKRAGVKPTQVKSGEMEDFGGLPKALQK
ncbi:hypothetical protein Q7P37_008822 [Cladosporium fusiforme]